MTRRTLLALSAAVLVLLTVPSGASAATVAWDGGGGNASWSNAANWDTNVVPTTGDDVVITDAGVTLDQATTVQTLTLSGTAVLSNGSYVLTASNADSGQADIVIGSGAKLVLTSSGVLASSDNVVRVQNANTTDGMYSGGSSLVASGATSLEFGGVGRFVWDGTFSTPSSLTAISVPLGTIEIHQGNLISDAVLTVGDGTASATFLSTGAGDPIVNMAVVLAAHANLDAQTNSANDGPTFYRGIDLNGSNQVSITGSTGAYVAFGGASALNQLGGDVSVTGTGELQLIGSGSTFDIGTHTLTLASGSTLRANKDTNNAKLAASAGSLIDGAGTLTWNGSNAFATGSVITTAANVVSTGTTNFDGSTFEAQGMWTATDGQYYNAPSITITPTGTLRNTDTTTTPLINAPLSVQGTVHLADDADLQFQSLVDFTNYSTAGGGTLTGGTWKLGVSSRLVFGAFAGLATIDGADVTLGSGATFAGSGYVDQLAGHAFTVKSSGSLSLASTATLSAGANTVTLDNGRLWLGNGSQLTASTLSLTNNSRLGGTGTLVGTLNATNGSIRPGDSASGAAVGVLTVTGAASIGASAAFNIDVSGSTTNDIDRLAVSGVATLTGGWSVSDDWAAFNSPAYSYAQPFLTAASFAGDPDDPVTAEIGIASPRQTLVTSTATSRVLEVTEQVAPQPPSTVTPDRAVNTWTNDATVQFSTLAPSDADSGPAHYVYLVDHSAATALTAQSGTATVGIVASVEVTLSSDADDWYFHVATVDQEGNVSTTITRGPFRLDATAPSTPTLLASPSHTAAASNDTTIDLSITGASDNISIAGYAISWTNGAASDPGTVVTNVASGALSVVSPVLADGMWYAHVRTIDPSGNVSTIAHSTAFTIDTVAPAAPSITGAPSGETSATSATLTLAGEAGATLQCSVDAGAFATCASPLSLTGLAIGSHSVSVRVVDGAGNVGATASAAWVVVAAQTPPVAPKASKIAFVGTQPKFAGLGTGAFKVKLPVAEQGVKVKVVLVLAAAQAKTLGLKVKKGQKSVVIGTGMVTSTKAGTVTVTVKLTTAAKNAFKAKAKPAAKLTSLKASIVATLTKGALSAKPVTKLITLRR